VVNLDKIKTGYVLIINKETYDVLEISSEIDRVDHDTRNFIGEHTEIMLHKIGDTGLHPTHSLKVYEDKIILLEIHQEVHFLDTKMRKKLMRKI